MMHGPINIIKRASEKKNISGSGKGKFVERYFWVTSNPFYGSKNIIYLVEERFIPSLTLDP